MKDYPNIPQKLVEALQKSFPDSCKGIKDEKELSYHQGQQAIIDHIKAIEGQQLHNKGSK